MLLGSPESIVGLGMWRKLVQVSCGALTILVMLVTCGPKPKPSASLSLMPSGFKVAEIFAQPDHEITIGTWEGNLRYDKEAFQVSPGSRVKVSLVNHDQIPHNWVLCDRGREGRVAVAEASLS